MAALDADWQALAQVAAGDTEAFGVLVARHELRLLRLCERLLGDREEARDAAQEAFIRVFRKASSLRPQGQFFTFLYRVGVNLCLNKLRRRRLLRWVSLGGSDDEDDAVPEPAAEGPDALRALAARERWQATRRALARLPANQRTVLVLAKFEGLPCKEIAATLGITEGAVESRLVRALRTLAAVGDGGSRPQPSAQEAAGPRVERRGAQR